MNLKAIRELAEKYTPSELETCIQKQLEDGENACYAGADMEETIDSLSKASYIRENMDKGMSITDAIRKLAQTIRGLELKK